MKRFAPLLLLAGCLAGCLPGCLPGDGRPPPGELLVEVAESGAAKEGFTTDDGWRIRFDRFVAGLGGTGVGEGASCIDYSLNFYDRLFDFTVADASKLHLHYGLGTCRLTYRLGSPSDEVILMGGVTEDDRLRMRDPRLDELFGGALDDDDELEGGVGLWVVGAAEKDGVTVRFDWELRTEVALEQCFVEGRLPYQVTLAEGDQLARRAEVRPAELFRELPSRESPFVFERYRGADADGDGEISLAELAVVLVDPAPVVEALADEIPGGIPPELIAPTFDDLTLERLLRSVLVPRVIAYEGVEECEFFNALELSDDD